MRCIMAAMRGRSGPARGHVVITIADNGPGIPEDELAHVVQPFVRLDHARTRDTPGMGLGLAIVEKSLTGEGQA
jgi:signal transduction histidine kinase